MIESVALNIVTYNEGHRIYETLQEASKWVDEIVVVDQQSTDNTCEEVERFFEIFKGYTLLGHDKHWGYCEPSRKVAWMGTTADWILVLDADEALEPAFGDEMRTLDDRGFKGSRLKRGFWLGGEHRFTGDYQFRFFHRQCVSFLNEIHTEPQPKSLLEDQIYSTPYTALLHHKTWQEQIRDEESYESIIRSDPGERNAEAKLALNQHLRLLQATGLTAEQADHLSIAERRALGLGAS